jgi:hypothetical protein
MFCIQIDDYKKKYKLWRKENNKMSHDGVLNFRHVDGVAESTKTMMMASKISVFFS